MGSVGAQRKKAPPAVPRDLILSTEAVEQLGIGYDRLRDWWHRGVVRSWTMGRRRLVSRSEVRRELAKRERPVLAARKGDMGPVDRVPLALPDHAPGWTPAGPWGYTSD